MSKHPPLKVIYPTFCELNLLIEYSEPECEAPLTRPLRKETCDGDVYHLLSFPWDFVAEPAIRFTSSKWAAADARQVRFPGIREN